MLSSPFVFSVNIQGSGVDVVFGDTGTIFINVTWHSEINITSFEWRKGGVVLNTSNPNYIVDEFPLPSLTVLNTTFDDEYHYELDIHTEKYDTQTSAFFLDIVGRKLYFFYAMYNNRHRSSFPSQISQISMVKYVQNVLT